MSALINDVYTSLATFLNTNLPALESRIYAGFRDERSDAASVRVYPYGTLILYDAIIARDEQNGAPTYIVKDLDANTADIFKVSNAVRLYFQFDTWCSAHDGIGGDWAVNSELIALFAARHTKVTTTDGRVLYIVPEQFSALDELAPDHVYRKDVRFSVVVWFAHPDDATTEKLLLQLNLVNSAATENIFDNI